MIFTRLANTKGRWLMTVSGCLALAGLLACSFDPDGQFLDQQADAGLTEITELQVKSKFSNIKVTRNTETRTLWFVRDNGEEVVESSLNLNAPHDLLIDYTRFMFLSYLFQPKPKRVLIVGLGGGSMVHFMNHYDPRYQVDVVEIDPQIITIAANYFGVSSNNRVNIMNLDGFAYLKNTDARYDVIYMDAFLKPSNDTDETGVPIRLKTVKFYKEIQQKLNPDSVVVFNINPHAGIAEDIATIREAFPQVYEFRMRYGSVVVGSMSPKRMTPAAMTTAARQLENRFPRSLRFQSMAARLVR